MTLTMANAAYMVLDEHGQPLHYLSIAKQLLERQLISSKGLTPGASLVAVISRENSLNINRGELPRFDVLGEGQYGLTKWRPVGVELQIQEINRKARQELRVRLEKMAPDLFEQLIGKLLIEIGFEEDTVEVIGRSGDGGIDVVGIINIEGISNIHAAVQVKRVKANIAPEKIRALRGSLLPTQRGIFITTSDFTSAAKQEASAEGKSPISLVNGDQILDLLFKFEIGVTSQKHTLYELDTTYWGEQPASKVTFDRNISATPYRARSTAISYPLRIFARPKSNEIIEATLLESGEVIFNNQFFSSVSAAGIAATGWKSCNGWKYWYFSSPDDGHEYLIDILRRSP